MEKPILLIYSFIAFTLYIWKCLKEDNVRKSISETYYFVNQKWYFKFSIASAAFPLAFIIPDAFMFIATGLICLVVAAPAFKGRKIEHTMHMIGAFGGYALAILTVLSYGYWYILLPAALASRILKDNSKNYVFWIEVIWYYVLWICILLIYLTN